MDEKDKRIAVLEAEIVVLRERLAHLERLLGLNSGNSSKPPSSDGLRKKPTPKSLRPKGEKSSGGQKGHKGQTLTQVETPSQTVVDEVSECASCRTLLSSTPTERVIKRQVFDLPAPQIEVTEHQAEVKQCPCGYQTTASFPEGVTAPVQYGPRVKALAVDLSTQQLIPEDRLQQTFEDVFALPISTATLTKMNAEFADQVAPLQEQVLATLKAAPVKGGDESGIRIGGKTQWLHTLSSPTATHYRVTERRGDLGLLNGLKGVLVHDHWKPYFTLDGVDHALCNAHHLRELKALEEIEKEPWAFKMSHLLRLVSRLKDPPLKRVIRLYDRIVTLVLLSSLMVFLLVPGAPDTNRTCDPLLRRKVLYPLSYGGASRHSTATVCIPLRLARPATSA